MYHCDLKMCRVVCLILACAALCMLCACTGGRGTAFTEPTPTPQTEQAESSPDSMEQGNALPEEQSEVQEEITEAVPDGVTPEFKEAMDSYEAFFDQYIEFMQVYEESENTSELMLEYADYMAQYAEMTEKIEAIDEDSLSTADQMYYIEVMSRVSQKLLAASEEE